MSIISLKCSICGSSSQVDEKTGRLECPNCGSYFLLDIGLNQLSGFLHDFTVMSSFDKVTEYADGIIEKAELYKNKLLKYLEQTHSFNAHKKKINEDILQYFDRFANLEELDLSDTAISDNGIHYLSSIKSLTKLNISKNKITDKGLSHLISLPKLVKLDVSETQISDAGLKTLIGLENLIHLNINDTNISNAGLAHILNFRMLEEIYLENTDVTEEGLISLINSATLKKIRIAYNDWKRIKMLRFITTGGYDLLKGITMINLEGQNVTDEDLQLLSHFPETEYLFLGDNQINGPGLENFKYCPKITRLDLSANPIGTESLQHLKLLKKLESLTINETRISQKEIKKLKRALWFQNPFRKVTIYN
jgi:internalin A